MNNTKKKKGVVIMNSYWYFEDYQQEDVNSSLPQHQSHYYIDIDFMRNLLFINFEETQTGIETLENTEEEKKKSKEELIHNFGLKYGADSILRVCFDFENNMIMIKTSEGKEDIVHFLNLEEHKEKILNCLGLETFSSEELQDDFEALLLMQSYEEANEEEKNLFMKSFINFKKAVDEMNTYIEQLETEIEISRELIRHQHEENQKLKEDLKRELN